VTGEMRLAEAGRCAGPFGLRGIARVLGRGIDIVVRRYYYEYIKNMFERRYFFEQMEV